MRKLTKEKLYMLIQEVVDSTVQEIELRGSLGAKQQVDVDWAAGKAEQITKEKIDFGDRGIKILSAPSNDHTKIILVPMESPEYQLSIGIKIILVSKLSTSIEPIYFFDLKEDAFKVR